MLGAIAVVVFIVVVVPVGVLIAGAVMAAVLGTSLKDDGEERAEGSELLDLNT